MDWGVNRTLFRNVAADLAQALQMNYAYGVEFVEVDPLTMGLDTQVFAEEVEEADTEPGESKSAMLEHVEQMAAERVGKEAGLLVVSGTMGNLVSILTHCGRGALVQD